MTKRKNPDVGGNNEGNEENSNFSFDTSSISHQNENVNNVFEENLKNMSEIGKVALEYLKRGFSIFPLWERAKTPILSSKTWECTWQEYQKRLPTEEEVITWWTKWPNANIGLVTGKISNIIVLDLDGKEAEEYLKEHEFEIPTTSYVKTGKGYHYYFKHPQDGKEYKNFARGKIKIDLRGDGGYVVAPPSIHPDGRQYQWGIETSELAEIPNWLFNMLSNKKEEKEVHHEFKSHESGEFPPSNFNKVVQGCPFIKSCVENAKHLPEPEWHSALSVTIFCENGEEHAHEISKPYVGYSFEETQKKIEKLMNFGPKKCSKIQEEHGDHFCQGCKLKDSDTSPIVLGFPDKLERAKKSIEDAFKRAEKCLDVEEVEETVTDTYVIGSLALIAEKDPKAYEKYKQTYQDKFSIGEAKLKNLLAQLRGEEMGRVVSHPSTKDGEEHEIFHASLHVNHEERNFYVWEGQGDKTFPVRVSNFIVVPLYSLKDQNGDHMYTVRFESENDQAVATIDPKSLTSNADFKRFCMQKGEFIWTGKPKHLDWLVEYLINHQMQKVHYIDHAGYNRQYKCWIFPTHAFIKGKVYLANQDGLIQVEDKIFKVMDNNMFKTIRPIVEKVPSKEDIEDYFQNLYTLYGNYGLLGIGWIVSGFQVHMFEEKMDTPQYPYLFATGIFQSGKTQFMRRMFELAGLKGKFDTNPTKDIWRKTVKAFASIPIVFDEVRDTGKNGFFNQMREVINKTFDRDDHKRGTIDPNAPLIYPTNAVVGFSGEVPTEDSAIMSRTVFVHSIHFTKNTKAFNRLARSGTTANWLGQYLQRTSHDWEEIVFQAFQNALEDMESFQIDNRELTNYALCVAGATMFMAIFNIPNMDEIIKGLLNFIKEIGERGKLETRESHPCIQYLLNLGVLASSTFPQLEEGEHYIIREEDVNKDGEDEKVLYLAPETCWQIFQKNFKDYDAFYNSSRKIKNDLESFKFFIGIQQKKFGKAVARAWKINLDHPDLPRSIKDFFAPEELEEEGNGEEPY